MHTNLEPNMPSRRLGVSRENYAAVYAVLTVVKNSAA